MDPVITAPDYTSNGWTTLNTVFRQVIMMISCFLSVFSYITWPSLGDNRNRALCNNGIHKPILALVVRNNDVNWLVSVQRSNGECLSCCWICIESFEIYATNCITTYVLWWLIPRIGSFVIHIHLSWNGGQSLIYQKCGCLHVHLFLNREASIS